MLRFREYVRAQSLEDAYVRNQKKTARIIGGMLWMKMQNRTIQTVIDLSDLGLDTIEENDEEYRIGAMVTLRQLELHEGLNERTGGALRESVKDIVGVQFRNLATVGGSLFGRFGFSDVLTMFLAMDSQVELYKGGVVSMEEFASMQPDNDILVRVIVKKTDRAYAYLSHRNTKTDFPVLTCGLALNAELQNAGRVVIGATPARAAVYPISKQWLSGFLDADEAGRRAMAAEFAGRVPTGSNIRAGKEYRSHLAGVLLYRGLEQLLKEEGGQSL